MTTKSVGERFWSKVDVRGPDECWPWIAGCYSEGYGQFHIGYIGWGAHRVAWTLTNGPIPNGMCVLHKCDNKLCCNPIHLFLGTQEDNMADKTRKGRAWGQKLTEEQVREIRRLRATFELSYRVLADEFGVSRSLIGQIVRRELWRHVQD